LLSLEHLLLLLPLLSRHFLVPDHVFDTGILHVLLLLLQVNYLLILLRILLELECLVQILHLHLLSLLLNGHLGVLPKCLILLMLHLLLHLLFPPEVLLLPPLLLVPGPDLHHLGGLLLGLFNFLPGLLLLQFQQCNSIGKQPGVLGGLLFVLTHGDQVSGDFIAFLLAVLLAVVILLVLVHHLLLEIIGVHFLIISHSFLQGVGLCLGYLLDFFRLIVHLF